ncbi:hypothetical protein, partial [Lactobacillus helveticus]|uniref:hypothetical protein n=1 Tax=Lactobacillus helveticus TaxID=1587 RepID=UPI001C26BC9C
LREKSIYTKNLTVSRTMISYRISSFFFYTLSAFLDIIESPQNKNERRQSQCIKIIPQAKLL